MNKPQLNSVLYAVGFPDGRIKIGRTTNAKGRLRAYSGKAWVHLFAPVTYRVAMFAERLAVDSAPAFGGCAITLELFSGLTKESAIACIRASINSAKEAADDGPMTINEIRLQNLEALIDEVAAEFGDLGSSSKLSKLTSVPGPLISQVRNRRQHPSGTVRTIGDITARKLEAGMGKPRGWLDRLDVAKEAA